MTKPTERLKRSGPFAKSFGIRVLRIGRGTATASMKVNGKMPNSHGVAHGGAVFSLVDAAFAAANNSQGVKSLALS